MNESGTERACISHDLTSVILDYYGDEKEIPLNPEKMKKLFHFSNVKVEPGPRLSFDAAMIYILPQESMRHMLPETGNKYLICSGFTNDEFNLYTKLMYGNKNQFMFIEGMFDDNNKSFERMDSYILHLWTFKTPIFALKNLNDLYEVFILSKN